MAISREHRRFMERSISKALMKGQSFLHVGHTYGQFLADWEGDPNAENLLDYVEWLQDGKSLRDFRIDKDAATVYTIARLMGQYMDDDDEAQSLIACMTAIAMCRNAEIPKVIQMDEGPRMSCEEFVEACMSTLKDYVVGGTFSDSIKNSTVKNAASSSWLGIMEDLGIADMVVTDEIARRILKFLWLQTPMSFMPSYISNTVAVFYNTAALFVPLVYKNEELRKELNRAKRKQATRKPTKKQSEVIEELRAQLADVSAKLSTSQETAKSEMHRVQTEHYREVEELKRKLEKVEQEKRSLQESLSDMLLESELQEQIDTAGDLPELPDSGIVFLGGHTRLIKYLRARHPTWVFQPAETARTASYGDASAVFLYARHMSHSAQLHAEKELGASKIIPIYSGTNLDKLERTMQYLYKVHVLDT